MGAQVSGTFTGPSLYFELAAPKKGTLVAALTWSGTTNGTVLVLNLNDIAFRPSPQRGRFPAAAAYSRNGALTAENCFTSLPTAP